MVSDLDSFANLQFWNYSRAMWSLHIKAAVSFPLSSLNLCLDSITLIFLIVSTHADSNFYPPPGILSTLWCLYHMLFLPPKGLWSQVLISWQRDREHAPASLVLIPWWCPHSFWTPGLSSYSPQLLKEKLHVPHLKCTAVCCVFPL